jgi:hypothetical protein
MRTAREAEGELAREGSASAEATAAAELKADQMVGPKAGKVAEQVARMAVELSLLRTMKECLVAAGGAVVRRPVAPESTTAPVSLASSVEGGAEAAAARTSEVAAEAVAASRRNAVASVDPPHGRATTAAFLSKTGKRHVR